MVEISEEAARDRGTYTVEDNMPMRRFRRFIDDQLDTIIYAGWDDPTEPLADFRGVESGVEAQIFSPVVRLPHSGVSGGRGTSTRKEESPRSSNQSSPPTAAFYESRFDTPMASS